MITFLLICLFAVAGYLLGSFNAGVIVSRKLYKGDVREHGSGNAGTTNMLRTYGKKAAFITLVFDFLKGILACLLPYLIVFLAMGEEHDGVLCVAAGALGAVIGHNWPVYFGFKGGKGVLVSFAVMLFIAPIPAVAALCAFIIIVAITRYVSLGSCIAALVLPIVMYFTGGFLPETKGPTTIFAVTIIICLMLIIRHHANIGRLIKGTESKLSFGGSGKAKKD